MSLYTQQSNWLFLWMRSTHKRGDTNRRLSSVPYFEGLPECFFSAFLRNELFGDHICHRGAKGQECDRVYDSQLFKMSNVCNIKRQNWCSVHNHQTSKCAQNPSTSKNISPLFLLPSFSDNQKADFCLSEATKPHCERWLLQMLLNNDKNNDLIHHKTQSLSLPFFFSCLPYYTPSFFFVNDDDIKKTLKIDTCLIFYVLWILLSFFRI